MKLESGEETWDETERVEETEVKQVKLLGETWRNYDQTKVEHILNNQWKLEETEMKLIDETERNEKKLVCETGRNLDVTRMK